MRRSPTSGKAARREDWRLKMRLLLGAGILSLLLLNGCDAGSTAQKVSGTAQKVSGPRVIHIRTLEVNHTDCQHAEDKVSDLDTEDVIYRVHCAASDAAFVTAAVAACRQDPSGNNMKYAVYDPQSDSVFGVDCRKLVAFANEHGL
jgi:hypothetical protein